MVHDSLITADGKSNRYSLFYFELYPLQVHHDAKMILRQNDDLSISTDAKSLKPAEWETNLQFFQNKGRIYLSKKSQVPKVVSSRYGFQVYF
jgi:hypothetical protein